MHIHARCNDTECVETASEKPRPFLQTASSNIAANFWKRRTYTLVQRCKESYGDLSTREFMMHSGTHTFRNCELQRFNSSRNFRDSNKEFKHSQSFEHASKQNREFLTVRICEHIDAEDSNLQRCNNSRHYKDLNKRSQASFEYASKRNRKYLTCRIL